MPAKNKTSFKKGSIPWNKTNIIMICEICKLNFKVTPSDLKNRPGKTCSRKCSNEYLKKLEKGKNKQNICLELFRQGKTIKEISLQINIPTGSISSHLNKAKFRRYENGGKSYSSLVKELKKEYKYCLICNFNRIIEIAHIIPASKGGLLTKENTLGLCPNHHYLFDNKKLTIEEAEKLKNKVLNYRDYILKGMLYAI